ncbi:MAG: CbiX/SirB N-terminal domain-containing protein [Pseudomonadota bacterium]|nr:CbiX/SirB N-terminal domain-containing protein [Pseudomonadota bacterium]
MTSSHRIVLLAHGSSDKRWRETFEQLAAPTLQAFAGSRIAYMELASPSLEETIAEGLTENIIEYTVVPLFLAAGRHLRKDVPAMIKGLEQDHGVKIHLAPPIGENPLLGQAIKGAIALQLDQAMNPAP